MRGVKTEITREEIINAIRALAQDLGRTPTRVELEQITGISRGAVNARFTRYGLAVRAAGLRPWREFIKRTISNEELLEDWGELARHLKRPPTEVQYQKQGKHSARCVVNRFGLWSRVPAAFQEAEAKGALKGEWKDVLEIIRRPAPERKRDIEWLRRFVAATRRISKVRGARTEYVNPGLPPSLAGKKCVTVTMLAVLVASIVLGGSFLRRVLPDRPVLGAPLQMAGLTHEPVNEMGVSMLFAMVSKELGFMIEAVQAAFPDCKAKMEVMPGRWQDVRIEFEYESRSFADHGHDPKRCDMIVCWRHNWKGCPEGMMVVELRKVIGTSQVIGQKLTADSRG